MFGVVGPTKRLGGDMCFKKWILTGSIRATQDWLFVNKYVSKDNKRFSRQSVYRTAWLWAAEFPEESFKFLKDSHIPYSVDMTLDKWKDEVSFHAFRAYTYHTQWDKIVEKNPDYLERIRYYGTK